MLKKPLWVWNSLGRFYPLNLTDSTHYFTISVEGPQLFAVDSSGIYHHDNQWCQYVTASDIKFSTIDDNGMGCPPRATRLENGAM